MYSADEPLSAANLAKKMPTQSSAYDTKAMPGAGRKRIPGRLKVPLPVNISGTAPGVSLVSLAFCTLRTVLVPPWPRQVCSRAYAVLTISPMPSCSPSSPVLW